MRPAKGTRRPLALLAVIVAVVIAVTVGAHMSSGGPAHPAPVAQPSPSDPPAAPTASGPATAPTVSSPTAGATRSPAPRPPAPPANLASRLRTLPSGTRQVVIVHATGYDTSYATLEAFGRQGSGWTPAFAAISVRIGANGFTDTKREGDEATPTGVYAIDATMYGIAANPGVRYAYHRLVEGDWWNENSDSPGYNSFVHGANPGGPSEALWTVLPQYTHFLVIRYNMPAVPYRGSGIFLHESANRSTLGCVSLPHANLVALLRWLDPAASPRIVLAPASVLNRY